MHDSDSADRPGLTPSETCMIEHRVDDAQLGQVVADPELGVGQAPVRPGRST
jgi:hypothetical protein